MGARAAYEVLETIPSTVLALSEGHDDTAVMLRTPRDGAEGGGPPERATEGGAARYEWLSLLGEGGMGRVERMRDRDLLREIAVKHVLPELRGDRRLVEQFLWEARITAHLDHPNIVPVHDLSAAPDGHLFFTMKLVRGRSLDDVIADWRGETAPLARRLRLFLQICNAVAFAHERGVLHRDLKPANVLVGDFGEVLVGDWGLAMPLDEAGEGLLTMAPTWLSSASAGTPSYMSPEQVAGTALDARSDIYALGVILYELVSLQGAFRGAGVEDVLAKVREGACAPLASVSAEAPRSLGAVVAKAMALRPEDRYESVSLFADDIETVLDGRTPEADDAALPTIAARYYVSHDPAMSRLRVIDYDMWMLAASLVGAAVAAYFATTVASYWWALGLAGLAVGAPTTRRWLRLRREGTRDKRS